MNETPGNERFGPNSATSSDDARVLFLKRVGDLERDCTSEASPYDSLLAVMQADSFRTALKLEDKASQTLDARPHDDISSTAVDNDVRHYLRQLRQLNELVQLGTD